MRIKTSYRYQISDLIKVGIRFYVIIILIYAALIALLGFTIDTGSDGAQSNGMDSASAVFVFIVGLCLFKENFNMLMQNSMSRKSLFFGAVMSAATLSIAMAVIDKLLMAAFGALTSGMDALKVSSYFEMMYNRTGMDAVFLNILFSFVLYLAVMAIGYFISIMFYRLGKTGKVAVGAGVPVLLVVVYPIIDAAIFHGKITRAILTFMGNVLGITNSQPLYGVLSLLVLAVVAFALCWAMMSRAAVKS